MHSLNPSTYSFSHPPTNLLTYSTTHAPSRSKRQSPICKLTHALTLTHSRSGPCPRLCRQLHDCARHGRREHHHTTVGIEAPVVGRLTVYLATRSLQVSRQLLSALSGCADKVQECHQPGAMPSQGERMRLHALTTVLHTQRPCLDSEH